MSRIGKNIVNLPKGVEFKLEGSKVSIKGPKGQLTRQLHSSVTVSKEGESVSFKPISDDKEIARFWGLTRTLVANMVEGVTNGFSKSLTLVGVGYRAAAKGKGVTLSLGYSHPIEFLPPSGIEIKVPTPNNLIISGPEKELVGQVAATIRGYRPPEPYHGKGVRYTDEVVATKVGKSGGKK